MKSEYEHTKAAVCAPMSVLISRPLFRRYRVEKVFNPEFYEADEEIQRFAEEKRIRWWVAEVFFTFMAFSAARKCTAKHLKFADAGGTSSPCLCGYHPSRRLIKVRITKETAKNDLKNIADKFGIAGVDNETGRAADILLQILDTAREQLKEPKLLRESYIDSALRSETFPALALDVMKYLRAGEINAKQTENALIEIKGRYQTLFHEMGIISVQAPANKK